jgi:hypothetical protein
MVLRNKIKSMCILLVLLMFLNLSFASALQISNVRSEDVTDSSAIIKWETDTAANSFLEYGQNVGSLRRIGDSNLVTNHQLLVDDLVPETNYVYSVQSNSMVDNNNGSYFSFMTPIPDIIAPGLQVELPEAIKGNTVDIFGKTEIGSQVSLFVNEVARGTTTAIATLVDENDSISITSVDANNNLQGSFSFVNVLLTEDTLNTIKVKSSDRSGNIKEFNGVVFADSTGPKLTLQTLPEVVTENSIVIKGSADQNSTLEIFLNNRSIFKEDGITTFEHAATLSEGINKIVVMASDVAGWETKEVVLVNLDAEPPKVDFEIVEGSEYYEGRASTNIVGETKPGAKVFLYVFRETGTRGGPDFSKAVDQVLADDEGKFTFVDVSFPPPPFTSWKQLAPKEVPAGLEEILISPLSELANEQRKSYKIYIIAEDNLGRSDYAPAKSVNVNTCFTGNAFDITPITQFQAPFRLDPGLMEEGRESIQAVFNLTYRGGAVAFGDARSGRENKAYEIIGTPQFRRACTQGMSESDDYGIGCKLLQSSMKVVPNFDKTGFYVTSDLRRADEFVERDEENNPWEKFQKSKLKLPIKIVINYKERNNPGEQRTSGTWSQSKTEVFCYDLSYFVDVPIESSDMIPDFLVDGALPALNDTINAIESVKPFLDTAMMVTGVSCVGSFLTGIVVQVYRQFISHFEPWTTRLKPDSEKCPDVTGQFDLYLEDTIKNWQELEGHPDILQGGRHSFPEDYQNKNLDKLCPQTANAWGIEEFFDVFYRATCDRFFCRAVPAEWTSEAKEEEVVNVVQSQLQCSATANGPYLEVVENCRDVLETNPTATKTLLLKKKDAFKCFRDSKGIIYYVDNSLPENKATSSLIKRNIWSLTPIDRIGEPGKIPADNLITYKPPGSERYMVAPDVSCSDMCDRVGDYVPVNDGYQIEEVKGTVSARPSRLSGKVGEKTGDWKRVAHTDKYKFEFDDKSSIEGEYDSASGKIKPISIGGAPGTVAAKMGGSSDFSFNDLFGVTPVTSSDDKGNFCYRVEGASLGTQATEGSDYKLKGQGEAKVTKGKVRAGYSKDCFVDDQGERYQCVCKLDEKALDKRPTGKREAVREINNKAEEWEYRQDAIYRETFKQAGTYYPEYRYYSGRDFTGAFGLDYGFDNFKDFETDANGDVTKNEKTTAQINPHTQTWGTFQAVCLPGINSRLEILQSVLVGLRNCLKEAKYTGLHDAGMCKTIFTQYVCSLFYKFLTIFTNSCSPISLSDVSLDIDPTDGGLSAAADAGFGAIPRALSSSTQKVRGDYANANLENFFASGTQGFAESLCLAAFGYDFPMGMDFIMDSAYSFSTKTSVFLPIASRELSTFNPAKGTATFNYNLAGTILPGCNIRGYKTYLKCIGPEDSDRPNVQCDNNEGCDCLRPSSFDSPFQGEKTYQIRDGTSFTGLDRNQMFDLPIPSPQKVSSNFRYDHVVVEINLDQGETSETCFDDGYRNGDKAGIFYFPITPIQSAGGINCFVDGTSGKFICPEIKGFFGGSTTYFEHPYMRCANSDDENFVSCETGNMFLLTNKNGVSDEIIVKPYMQLGGEAACLVIKDSSGLISKAPIPIPAGISGPFSPTVNLGSVSDSMISGSGVASIGLISSKGSPGCKRVNTLSSPSSSQSVPRNELIFKFAKLGSGIKLTIPDTYGIPNEFGRTTEGVVTFEGREELTRQQVDEMVFETQGFRFNGVLGNAESGSCVYQINPGTTSVSSSVRPLRITASLYRLPESGSCASVTSRDLFPKGALGLPTHPQTIIIQSEASELSEARGIHAQFLEGKYPAVIAMAKRIINNQEGSFDAARAFYYNVASLIMQESRDAEIRAVLDQYFSREFSSDTEKRGEFKKIDAYMCEIDATYGGSNC